MPSFDFASSIDEMRQNLPQPKSFFARLLWRPPSRDLIPEVPGWERDPLWAFWANQKRLLRTGRIVWCARIQANALLYSPGVDTCPGEVVASFAPELDADPHPLIRTAERIYALKGTRPQEPDLRLVAARITDEYYRALGERLPEQLTEGWEMFRFTILFCPKHLPQGFINGRLAPLLVLPDCGHAMLLPHWYWSNALAEDWKPTLDQWKLFRNLKKRP